MRDCVKWNDLNFGKLHPKQPPNCSEEALEEIKFFRDEVADLADLPVNTAAENAVILFRGNCKLVQRNLEPTKNL